MCPSIASAVANLIDRSIDRGIYTTTGNGTGVDISDLEGVLAFTFEAVAVGGTTPSFTPVLTTSDDNASFVALQGGATFIAQTAVGQQRVFIDKRACKKFVRLERTISGTSPSFTTSLRVDALPKYQ